MTDNWTNALGEIGDIPGQEMLRLRSEEEVEAAFLGNAKPHQKHYSGIAYDPCPGNKCPYDHEKDPPQTRVLVDLYLLVTRQSLIFEATPILFQEMVRLRTSHPIDQWTFRIRKEGMGKETRYFVEPGRLMTAEQLAAVAAAARHDLAARVETEKQQYLKKMEDAIVDDVKHDPSEYSWDLGDEGDAAKGSGI